MNALIEANLHYIVQAERLLAQLTDETFSQESPAFYRSTIGGHLRHCLDHYDSFLNALQDGKVDYDERMRLPALETETASAAAKATEIRERLEIVSAKETPVGLLVKMDCGIDNTDWQPSTLGRELQFLVSHTVHHFAMIGGICRELGIEPEKNFGVAPSTIRHHANVSA
ncbi:MAG: DinB family protein [Roseibacillus sp.]